MIAWETNLLSVHAKEPGKGAIILLHLVYVRLLSLCGVCRPVIRHLQAPIHLLRVVLDVLVEDSEAFWPELAVKEYMSVLEVEGLVAPNARVEIRLQDDVCNFDLGCLIRAPLVHRCVSEDFVDGFTSANILLDHLVPGLFGALIREMFLDLLRGLVAQFIWRFNSAHRLNHLAAAVFVGDVADSESKGAIGSVNHLLNESIEHDFCGIAKLLFVLALPEDSVRDCLIEEVP